LFVLKNGGVRAKSFKKSEIVGSSSTFSNSFEVCCEVRLEPDIEYTIFVSTFKPEEEAQFTLSAFCRHNFALRELENVKLPQLLELAG